MEHTDQLDGPIDRYRALRDAIHDDVCSKGFDTDRGTFTQYYGSRSLDAALLLIPQVGFLAPEDERVRGTLRAIERELAADGLVRRYDTDRDVDGLPGGEGAFLACSFWLADALVLDGQVDEGRRRFEELLRLRNDVGLLAEEYDATTGRHLGNVPQAYSHLALVNSALNLAGVPAPDREAPAEQRAGDR
jgi:GH15 family glucan-1,4-alpha-glucosidase